MKNQWRISILHATANDPAIDAEVINIDIEDGQEEFTVQRDPERCAPSDVIQVTKNGVESLCSFVVYKDSIKILDLPFPSQVSKVVLDAKCEDIDPAIVALWRSHFERLNPYLEMAHTLDAWDRRIYVHVQIQSLWSGFVQAMRMQMQDVPAPIAQAPIDREKAKKRLFVVWTEGSAQHVNTFEDNPAARVEARETVQFVEAREGAVLDSVIVGYAIDKAAL